jgi:hypothetical protein
MISGRGRLIPPEPRVNPSIFWPLRLSSFSTDHQEYLCQSKLPGLSKISLTKWSQIWLFTKARKEVQFMNFIFIHRIKNHLSKIFWTLSTVRRINITHCFCPYGSKQIISPFIILFPHYDNAKKYSNSLNCFSVLCWRWDYFKSPSIVGTWLVLRVEWWTLKRYVQSMFLERVNVALFGKMVFANIIIKDFEIRSFYVPR